MENLNKLSEYSGQPAGVERVSRLLQFVLNVHCERVCAAEHAPRGPFRLLERRHGLAVIYASTATATASLYFWSAWYCSALPPR